MAWLRVRAVLFLAVLTAAVSLTAADLPWVGKWKINVAKSNFGESTVTYAAAGPGEMQSTADGMTMKFKMDGKEYPDPLGGTAAWKEVDASTWETANKVKGKLVSTETRRLSADGKTLTLTAKGSRPDGKPFEDEVVYSRVSGGPGLAGKWKTSKVSLGAPGTIDITAYENDGLTLRVEEWDMGWSARFDGKDNPVKGPTVPDAYTTALTRTGPRSVDYVDKQNGKVVYKGSITVSPDGKTTTVVGGGAGTTEKMTAVYDRQ